MAKISVLIATYNRPEALKLVLAALNEQSDTDFEVVIGDDGSSPETAELIQQFQKTSFFPIKHVWQEDCGFRLAMIRNKAAAAASGDYLIFLDDDCPMPKWFIANHRRLAETNYYVVGNRILLSQMYTEALLKEPQNFWRQSRKLWSLQRLRGNCNRLLPLYNFPLGYLRKLHPRKWQGLRGCNLALWKEDLIKVNGFNESFVGWGYEDSDFVIRLMRTGVKRKSGRFAVPVFHLWHQENDRSNERKNFAALDTILTSNVTQATQGINQYL